MRCTQDLEKSLKSFETSMNRNADSSQSLARKVYLDQSIIDEWLKFKSKKISLNRYIIETKKTRNIGDNLKAFRDIINMPNHTFLYSNLNEIECSKNRREPFSELVSSPNFQKVPTVGLRSCMVDQTLPSNNIIEIGEVQAYYASNINKFGNRQNKNIKQYMRKKFFDDMHVDCAIRGEAEVLLTIDFNFLRRIRSHPEFQGSLKIRILTPLEFIRHIRSHPVKGDILNK